nr:MetQ/NlpA family ABC transporter substrate-binding protein [Facklamia languida]
MKPYFNLITTLPDRVDDPTFEAIITAYHQDNVKNHIKEEYNNGMILIW